MGRLADSPYEVWANGNGVGCHRYGGQYTVSVTIEGQRIESHTVTTPPLPKGVEQREQAGRAPRPAARKTDTPLSGAERAWLSRYRKRTPDATDEQAIEALREWQASRALTAAERAKGKRAAAKVA